MEGAFLIFTSDYSFSSASAAAAAVIGASANGRILWKLPDGRIYADWEAGQGSSPETGTDHTGFDDAADDPYADIVLESDVASKDSHP